MKIYTKTGDDGTTGLFGGIRLGKDALRVDAYGCVDELNACLGTVLASSVPEALAAPLRAIQSELFALGAELATVPGKEDKLAMERLGSSQIARLEAEIDRQQVELPELKTFVLPGGGESAARLHVARTVCRRAERKVVQLSRSEPVAPQLITYLNRLSDLLFVLSRRANQLAGVEDVPWLPRGV